MPERHWRVRPLDPVYAIVYFGEIENEAAMATSCRACEYRR